MDMNEIVYCLAIALIFTSTIWWHNYKIKQAYLKHKLLQTSIAVKDGNLIIPLKNYFIDKERDELCVICNGETKRFHSCDLYIPLEQLKSNKLSFLVYNPNAIENKIQNLRVI